MPRKTRDAQTLRFGVGSPNGPRSATWRLWTKDSDVYIAGRSMAGKIKVSLHASGVWRLAVTEAAARSSSLAETAKDRLLSKWTRPAEFAAGWTKAFQVIIPSSEATTARKPTPIDRTVYWAPRPGHDRVTYFTVLFSAEASGEPGWPGRDAMGTRLVGRLALLRGQTVWLVEHDEPLSPAQKDQLASLRATAATESHKAADWNEPRAWFFGDAPDGSRFYVDVSMAPADVL